MSLNSIIAYKKMDIHEALALLTSGVLANDIIITRSKITDIYGAIKKPLDHLYLTNGGNYVMWWSQKPISIDDIAATDFIMVLVNK